MQRIHQLVFCGSLAILSWLAMMAVHELGHVLGAWITGAQVQRVVLNPLAISRTDVSPNPHPTVVIWLGPIVGCLLPLAICNVLPNRMKTGRKIAVFFSGFCLIVNGAYISLGSFGQIGDCGEMLQNGTPTWVMHLFGVITVVWGLLLWHGLGSLSQFLSDPSHISPKMAYFCAGIMLLMAGLGFAFSHDKTLKQDELPLG